MEGDNDYDVSAFMHHSIKYGRTAIAEIIPKHSDADSTRTGVPEPRSRGILVQHAATVP